MKKEEKVEENKEYNKKNTNGHWETYGMEDEPGKKQRERKKK